jgi:hypothetical protein
VAERCPLRRRGWGLPEELWLPDNEILVDLGTASPWPKTPLGCEINFVVRLRSVLELEMLTEGPSYRSVEVAVRGGGRWCQTGVALEKSVAKT